MFSLENRGETLIFMSCHFDETVTILISHFLRFGALKIVTCDYFVLRISEITYSKQEKLMFYSFQYFSHSILSPFICTGWVCKWHTDKITYQQVNV